MKPVFTILLPVHRPPALLPYAIESVLAQDRGEFELFIVCDGAPDATVESAQTAAQDDSRIRVFANPKGERHGEAHRHQALRQANGRLVCHIADDDLWFPNHLTEMEKLLEVAEFGNVLQVVVSTDDSLLVWLGNLANAEIRTRMATRRVSFFGPTVAGYRLSSYRRLPVGWAPAPRDIWTDLHMWRKFLALPDIACATRFAFTSLHFPSPSRQDWTLERRRAELAIWANRVKDARFRDCVSQELLGNMINALILYRQRGRKRN